MLITRSGNIIHSTMQTLTLPCNLVGIMGAGLAKYMATCFPTLEERYRLDCATRRLDIGHLTVYPVDDGRQILAFPTKRHWRPNSKLEWIAAGLMVLARDYESLGITSLALPMLGCGRGQLEWVDVRPLIEEYLSELPIDIEIYEP